MESKNEVRQIIEQHDANAERYYASGAVDSLASLFAEDAWQMPPNRPPLIGRQAIREFWSQAVQWGTWEFTLRTQDVVVREPIAVERGKYVVKFTAGPSTPPGLQSFQDEGNYVVYWHHENDGEWRIVWDAPVSILPQPGSTM